MGRLLIRIGGFCVLCAFLLSAVPNLDWGFFGHRKINRLAVFTLPNEMFPVFKKNIEWLTEHAIDPDKRRYAAKHEAVRHYIDIDHWGDDPFERVPKNWDDALIRYMDISLIKESGDTIHLFDGASALLENDHLWGKDLDVYLNEFTPWFSENVRPIYFEDVWQFPAIEVKGLFSKVDFVDGDQLWIQDKFSEYGILPYHLYYMYNRLIRNFEDHDTKRLLRTAAEFGHYLGDAHVPLHTTENYNGQLTNQIGIHAFWESRLPELFADEEYDFFVGKAIYIEDPVEYFWNMVEVSHGLLDSVLQVEKRLSIDFPQDQQFCYEDRFDKTIKTQCEEYARAYHEAMDGMVEKRMRDAVLAIGSVWYSAWVDAGQPDLTKMDEDYQMTDEEKKIQEETENKYREGDVKGRAHGG